MPTYVIILIIAGVLLLFFLVIKGKSGKSTNSTKISAKGIENTMRNAIQEALKLDVSKAKVFPSKDWIAHCALGILKTEKDYLNSYGVVITEQNADLFIWKRMFYIGAFMEFNGAPQLSANDFAASAQSLKSLRRSYIEEWEPSRKWILDELSYLKGATAPMPIDLMTFLCDEHFNYSAETNQTLRSKIRFPEVFKHHYLYTAYINAFMEG